MLWFILEIYDYYKRTSDSNLIESAKEKIYGVLNYLSGFENEIGLLENLPSWVFVEWSKANDFVRGVNFPSNMLYAKALSCVQELYSDKALRDKADKIKRTILEKSFNGCFFEDNMERVDGKLVKTGNISETCQYYTISKRVG